MNSQRNEKLRILVVEDNEGALHMLCELLGVLGHEATAADTAELGWELLQRGKYHVLLTDINLPGKSGLELAQDARELAPEMKIVFVSGNDKAVLATLNFPAAWISKPLEYSALVQTLKAA
jgi:DNA-binding response OmpR family regulator